MGLRKNVKFLSTAEKDNFVKACVLMKADIVNPTAPVAARYDRWVEFVAIHQMIQNGFAPDDNFVNFGHGGSGSYSFLSWHRYFLYRFERQLRTYVPGVRLPYWDWTDLSPLLTDTFLGPDGSVGNEVRSGYFARNAPGTTGNSTPAPAWWPAGLSGWTLPAGFGIWQGALRRIIKAPSLLPSASDLRNTLAQSTYAAFQNELESGAGLSSFPAQQMHNGLHGWIGGHMSNPSASPFDPVFFLHHCNIDRLWAMWQIDGHADEYPATGGQQNHRRNDIMYPWTGGTAGYGTNAAIVASIPMPDFTALGAQRNVDTLDFRHAYGYTYDTLAVIGVGLDRADSMNGMTPDPMLTSAPDVSKWQAARRGVSAFLQDCETIQASSAAYVTAGIKTFHRVGTANDFVPVLAGPGYGLVKNGGVFGRGAFDGAAAGMTASGTAPLADALLDVRTTLVEPPFARVSGERRYLAMLSDGLLTAGAVLSSIPDHSLGSTAVFAMGFGIDGAADYANLSAMVAKGVTLGSQQQVFHGENAGTIDKFFSNALARAMGFTALIDPVFELFEGEHTHFEFDVTSAEEALLITIQGMDFDDSNWTFHLHAPDGAMAYGMEASGHMHDGACMPMCCRRPDVVATRGNGRLSLVLQRDSADDACWVGGWRLLLAYRARQLDAMLMPNSGELIQPVSAGPVRGPRYSRLLTAPRERVATRNIRGAPRHRLDERTAGTNHNDQPACNVVVNIYGRTRLRMELVPDVSELRAGCRLAFALEADVPQGNITIARAFARLFAPTHDLAALLGTSSDQPPTREAVARGSKASPADPAMRLAMLEKRDPGLTEMRDEELEVMLHADGRHKHVGSIAVDSTIVPGIYHVGVLVEGQYCPVHGHAMTAHQHGQHDHAAHAGAHNHEEHAHEEHAHEEHVHPTDASICDPDCSLERFTRVLTTAVALPAGKMRPASKSPSPKTDEKKVPNKRRK